MVTTVISATPTFTASNQTTRFRDVAKGDAPSRDSGNGARGRNRTTDTMIFSHVLYQLSYPGIVSATIHMDRRALVGGLWRSGRALATP